ncbi:MAG TPA: RHS repeat-associated core domain-containing protein [Thermoanaerobaculia bacterium]|nr:RHS repeat-associated core domain-containing protein [Thermoanaerobaculia bacterium]
MKSSGTVFEFAAVDRTIDPRTGLTSAEKDVSQLQTTYEYDTLGRLTWVQPAQGHGAWTEYAYTRATNPSALAKVTINQHSNGNKSNPILTTSSLYFDSFGRLIKEQRKMPGGTFSNRETTYDAIGNRATVSEWEAGVPSNTTKYLDYDPFGRPRTIQPSDGAAHAVTITRSGVRVVTKRTKIWGPCGTGGALQECSSDTVELYDQVGRLFRIDQPVAWPATPTSPLPAPLRTSYAYDIGDRLKTVKQFDPVTQAIIQQRDFNYDNRGFLNSEKHPELGPAGVTYSNYDARGHAGGKQDGVSDLTFEYDRAERMTRVRETGTFIGCGTTLRPRCLKEYTFGTGTSAADLSLGKVQLAKRYNYPVLGTTTHTVAVAETYTYAGREGRASKRDTQVFFNTAATEAFTQRFTYDDLGNTASLTYPLCTQSGCAPPPPQTATPKIVNFTYTEGLLTSVRDASLFAYASSITYNSNQTISQVVHSNGITDVIGIDPNAQQRPASIVARNGAGTNLWNAGTYLYDGVGNIKSIGGSGFAYDPASRLITANLWDGTGATGTPLKTQGYVYDLFGNLQSITGQGGRNTPTSSVTNRLNGPGMAFDAAGSQTNNNGAVHEYDPFHLMWHFQSGAEDWRYVYTAEDERIWSFKTGGSSRWTLRDLGNNVLREYANNGGTWSVTEDFIHRGGQLLAADTTTGVSHFHLDHLGTPRLVTNQSGVKIAYHVYWPYGEELTVANQDAERMKFTGHERDLNGSGGVGDDLDYMHARFCSPVTGRFLGVDSVGGTDSIPVSWNRYSYAYNNPLKLVDPDGDHPVVLLIAAAIVALISEPEAANAPESREEHAAGIPRKDEAGTMAAAAKAAGFFVGMTQLFSEDASRGDDDGSGSSSDSGKPSPKEGSSGGPGAGKRFPESVKTQERADADNKCRLCGQETASEPGPTKSEIDHAHPKSRDGNNTLDNAQNTCRTCNRTKGASTTSEYLERILKMVPPPL